MLKGLKKIPYKPERNVFLRARYVSNRILELSNGVKVQANIQGKVGDEVDIFLSVMPESSWNTFPIAIVLGNRTRETESRYYLYESSKYFGRNFGVLTGRVNTTTTRLNVNGNNKFNCKVVEIPDGIRTNFSFQDPASNTLNSFLQYSSRICKNGLRQEYNVDYTEIYGSGIISFTTPPLTGDIIYGDFNIAW